MKKTSFLIWSLLLVVLTAKAQVVDYNINGSIQIQVMDNYLKRSAMVTGIAELYIHELHPQATPEQAAFENFVSTAHPKMLLGINLWTPLQYLLSANYVSAQNDFFSGCARFATAMHTLDQSIILGASLDEVISNNISGGPNSHNISIPSTLLGDYNLCLSTVMQAHPEYNCSSLAVTSTPATFDTNDIRLRTIDATSSYVDISRDMAQLWYFYLATRYIDRGFEMLRLGQIEITSSNDPNHAKTLQLVQVIREYARRHALRGIVLFEEQTPTTTYFASINGNICIFDIAGLPTRLSSRKRAQFGTGLDGNGNPEPDTHLDYEAVISSRTPAWANYGGGLTTYWGTPQALPAYAELDNTGDQMWATTAPNNSQAYPPVENKPINPSNPNGELFGYPWGWDETSWFYNQSLAYEQQWLVYINKQVQCLSNGSAFFCMPVRRNYNFHAPSATLHEGMFNVYYNDQSSSNDFKDLSVTIKTIWDSNTTSSTAIKTPFNSWPSSLPVQQILLPNFDPQYMTLANLNADGLEDIILSNPVNFSLDVYLTNSSNNSQITYSYVGSVPQLGASSTAPSFKSRITVGDFNGDGFDDFILTADKRAGEYYAQYRVYLNTLNTNSFSSTFISGPDMYGPSWGERIYVGDFNNDRFDDLLVTADKSLLANAWGGYRLYLNNGNSTATAFTRDVDGTFPSWGERFFIGDYNGDGKADFLVTSDEAVNSGYSVQGYKVYHSQTTSPGSQSQIKFVLKASSSTTFPSWGENIIPFDINGDRRTDLLITAASQLGFTWNGYKAYIANSTGEHFMFASESSDVAIFGKDNQYAKINRPSRAQQLLTSYNSITGNLVYTAGDYSCAPSGFVNRVASTSQTSSAIATNVTSATQDRRTTNIILTPNPASNFVEVSSPYAVQECALVDMNGRIVRRIAIADKQQFTVDVQDLRSGIYILQLVTPQGLLRTKLITMN